MKTQNLLNAFRPTTLATCLAIFGSTVVFAQIAPKVTSLPNQAMIQVLQQKGLGEAQQNTMIQKIIQQQVLKKVELGRSPSPEELKLFKARGLQGGGDTGGGSVVVCYDTKKNIKSVEVYDIYEAKRRYGINPNYENTKTVEEALSLVLGRLYKLDPITAQELSEQVNIFSADSVMLDDSNPPLATDLNPIIIPAEDSGCKIVSAILQKKIRW